MTPRTLHRLSKLAFALATTVLLVLMLGPFQGLERRLGLTDKTAHAIAFFALANGLFLVAPRTRRTDLAGQVLIGGLVIELLQGLSGRGVSIGDFGANALGVAAALIPGYVERLRQQVRAHPDVPLRQLLTQARGVARASRRRRRRAAAKPADAETPTGAV